MKKALLLFLLLGFVFSSCKKSKFEYQVNNIVDITMKHGDTAYMNVEVKLLEGNAENVNLTIEGLPSDIAASFSTNNIVPTYTAAIRFIASNTIPNGIYLLTLNANSILGQKRYRFKLILDRDIDENSGTPFTYAVNNVKDLTVQPGNSASMDLEVKLLTGNPLPVGLSVSGLPTGVTSGFSTTSSLPTFNSKLTLTAASTAVAGTYPVTIKSSTVKGIQQYSFNLKIGNSNTPFNFTVNNVNDITIVKGNSGSLNLEVLLTGGTTENVNLALSGLPSNASSTFSSASGLPTFNSTLNINTTNSTALGTYPVTIAASSTTAGTKNFSFNLKVIADTSNGGGCAGTVAGTYISHSIINAITATSEVTSTGENSVHISNLTGFEQCMLSADAIVDCDAHTVTIPMQFLPNLPIQGISLSGTGTFDEHTITLHYTVNIFTLPISCTATLTR